MKKFIPAYAGKMRFKRSAAHLLSFCMLTILAGCVTPTVLVNQEQKLGDQNFNQFNYAEAARHYLIMVEANSKLGIYRNLQMEADVRRKLANCFEMTGKYDLALSHVREAMILDSLDNNLLGTIEDYRQEGKIQVYSGLYQNAIKSLEKSVTLADGMDQSIKNTYRLTFADTYLALGQLYAIMGKISTSQNYTNKALSLFEQAGDKKGQMESFLTLASLFSDLGDNTTSRNFTMKSLQLAGELEMGTARHYHMLASISTSIGAYEEALRSQQKAIESAMKYKIVGQIVWSAIGMGDIYRELGDFNRAEKYYNQARMIRDTSLMNAESVKASLNMRIGDLMSANQFFASQGSVSGEGISSFRIAEIMIEKGKPDSALIFLNQCRKLFRQASNLQGKTNVQLMEGRLLVDKGDLVNAKPLLDSAGSVAEFPESAWQAFYQTGRLFEKLNDNGNAIQSYKKAISIIEKIRGNLTVDEFKSIFFDSKREVYDRLIQLLLKENRSVEAFQTSEQSRARAFYDNLANKKINFRASLPEDLIVKEQEKRIEMQKLYLLLQNGTTRISEGDSRKSNAGQIRKILTETQAEYEDLLQKIKLNNPSYSELITATPVNLSALQSALDAKTSAISYWISDKELLIWLISKSSITCKAIEIEKSALNNLVEKARIAIQTNAKDETVSYLSKLYSVLIEPLEGGLKGIDNLIIIPNGGLHFLPFQTLIDKKGAYLVQKYNLVYSPSASVYMICRNKENRPGTKFMGMALSDVIVGNNVGLPGTEEELKKILPLFKDEISTFGTQSTESFVKLNAGNYNFLHFATHGSYNYKRPIYSYLLFPPSSGEDGLLNVFEVFELNLNSKLVTLSACETGLGNISQGDELTGLSRAFLFAGSASVVVSLWAVADYPTSLLMTNFYSYMKDRPIQEALTMAQRDVLKVFPQPVYWSPFIIIGNGMIKAN